MGRPSERRPGVLRAARVARTRAGVATTPAMASEASPRYNATGPTTRAAIEAYLIAQGRTWASVARAAGVAPAWLYMLAQSRAPTIEAVQAVASVLQVHPSLLLWPETTSERP